MLDRPAPFSNWNPQLWREVKPRFTRRSGFITAAASIGGQGLLYQSCARLPTRPAVWQFQLFHRITWIGMLLLLVLGCYLLVKNIRQEARRGTLMFLQLTPEPADRIILGKLLGVPSLLYWAIALVLPLHLWAGVSSGISPQVLVIIYSVSAIVCGFCYCFALTYALGWQAKAQTWYISVLVCCLYLVLFLLWQGWTEVDHASDQILFAWIGGFISLGLSGPIGPLWKMSVARFHRPTALFVLPQPDRKP